MRVAQLMGDGLIVKRLRRAPVLLATLRRVRSNDYYILVHQSDLAAAIAHFHNGDFSVAESIPVLSAEKTKDIRNEKE